MPGEEKVFLVDFIARKDGFVQCKKFVILWFVYSAGGSCFDRVDVADSFRAAHFREFFSKSATVDQFSILAFAPPAASIIQSLTIGTRFMKISV